VIDDGSTDGTLAILQAYQTMDTRIRLVTRGHKGIVATINEGIDLARGKWLARMDADDMPYRTVLSGNCNGWRKQGRYLRRMGTIFWRI